MDSYIVVLAGFGAVVLLTAWLPMLLRELPLSLPIFCVALGAALFALPLDAPGTAPHPRPCCTDQRSKRNDPDPAFFTGREHRSGVPAPAYG